ncbi:MAG: UDP-N-acetylglucosamine 2-epimerase (non-hydrolyzing) [Candidatus Bathyarchaeia archaeon]
MSILIVTGTRPEIIKMAPVIKKLEKRNVKFTYAHTGQHYDYEMTKVFISELGLPAPDIEFKLSNSDPGAQIGEIIIKLEKALGKRKEKLKILLIEGDTNTVLAASIAALKNKMKIGHVEAGLRSFDWKMPEEHNRRMTDHVSDLLFAPTGIARQNLEEERVWGKIFVVGNTVIDALKMYFDKVLEVEDKMMGEVKFDEYALVTFHRSENVDDLLTLRSFVEILQRSVVPIVFPIHPRTKKKLNEYGLLSKIENINRVQLLSPLGYFEFLALMRNAKVIMTDSGGIQEEVTYPRIKKPVLVLRNSTERPEAVAAGFARVVGLNPSVVLTELEKTLNSKMRLPNVSPFGDGNAAQRVIDVTIKNLDL